MKKTTTAMSAIVITVILVVGLVFVFSYREDQVVDSDYVPVAETWKKYRSESAGVAFSYPADYVLTEAERGNAERSHYSIVLVRAEDAVVPENGEGPTAISIDIYQNNLDKQTLIGWLTDSNQSNFKLSPTGTYASTTVGVSGGGGRGEVEAVNYRWSGLYEGETTAFVHRDNIVAMSVTWLTPEDRIVSSYRSLMKSLSLF